MRLTRYYLPELNIHRFVWLSDEAISRFDGAISSPLQQSGLHHAPTDWWRALQPFLGVSSDGRAGEWRHALQRECGALRAVPQRGPKRRPKREPEREPSSTSAGSRAQPPAPAPAPATAPATAAARARPSFLNRVFEIE